jgi:hypothetical protein
MIYVGLYCSHSACAHKIFLFMNVTPSERMMNEWTISIQPTQSQAKKGLGPTRNTHKVPFISIHLADAFYLTTLMVACDIMRTSHMSTPSIVPPVHIWMSSSHALITPS